MPSKMNGTQSFSFGKNHLTLFLGVALLAGCASGPPELPPPVPAAAYAAHPESEGSIYGAGLRLALFEDRKARAVGDTLTVVLVEQTRASKSASTSTSKDDSVEITGPTLFGRPVTHQGVPILDTRLGASREFSGAGDSAQSNALSGSVTVRVVQVRANGNLVIAGEKQLTLNQGDEHIRISGEVHPADIAADNTVLSSRVADARIEYAGTGALADANAQGWLSRFFSSWLWPF
jgi:flagellar L-ring protein FlgH